MKTILLTLITAACTALHAATLEEQIADRAAIERVYHAHRTGITETFAQTLPAADLRRLVARDSAREKFLRTRYGVEISAPQIVVETTRINATTRAPETLAEIKAALGNDPTRFAGAFVKPILVERELRRCFANDDAIHADLRRAGENARTNLLNARAAGASPAELVARLTRDHTNSITLASWQLDGSTTTTAAFANLPPQLREVLAAQLRAAGDVSALIETPENFLLYVAREKTESVLSAACLSLPKPDCDSWLARHSAAETVEN